MADGIRRHGLAGSDSQRAMRSGPSLERIDDTDAAESIVRDSPSASHRCSSLRKQKQVQAEGLKIPEILVQGNHPESTRDGERRQIRIHPELG